MGSTPARATTREWGKDLRDLNRDFITGVLRDLVGWVPMALATGRSKSNKLEIRATEWFNYPADLEKMVDFAEKKRAGDRRNVYLGPSTYGEKLNENGERERSIVNALMCQTIYMDSDTCPPDAFRIEPSRHVNTSPGHGHDYWFLAEPIPTKEAAEIAHRITTAHEDQGCDPSGWSANKYLRMPTVNTSYDAENPFKITYHDTGEIHDPLDISGAYDNVVLAPAAPSLGAAAQPRDDIPLPEDLPDAASLVDSIPSSARRLNELIFKVPKRGEGGWQSQQRFALLADLYRYGFKIEEMVSIAWSCPAADKWKADQRGVDGLWMEARKAIAVVDLERAAAVEPDDYRAPEPVVKHPKLKLVTKSQRDSVADVWEMREQYQDWARTRVPVYNDPYHSISAWVLLSLAYGEWGFIPKESGPMHPNIYVNTIGESSSGKSEAEKLQYSVFTALFPHDSPDIGADFSKNGLVEHLLERDGKVSWIHADEAHGVYRTWKANGGGWTTGIQETYTLIYDGPVPSQGRVGKKIHTGATAIPVMQMTGTPEGMFDVLDRPMFLEGYLARTLWVIGQDIPITEESIKTKQVTSVNTKVFYKAMPSFWASVVGINREKITADLPFGEKASPLLMTDEALELFDAAKWALVKFFDKLDDPTLFRTSRNRLFDIIWKAAGLLAMSEGEVFITSQHVTRALIQAEVWVESLVYVADRINNSKFSKACDDIEKFIGHRPGREVEVSAIYTKFRAEDIYQIDRYLDSLQKQRRVTEHKSITTKMVHYALPRAKQEEESAA